MRPNPPHIAPGPLFGGLRPSFLPLWPHVSAPQCAPPPRVRAKKGNAIVAPSDLPSPLTRVRWTGFAHRGNLPIRPNPAGCANTRHPGTNLRLFVNNTEFDQHGPSSSTLRPGRPSSRSAVGVQGLLDSAESISNFFSIGRKVVPRPTARPDLYICGKRTNSAKQAGALWERTAVPESFATTGSFGNGSHGLF